MARNLERVIMKLPTGEAKMGRGITRNPLITLVAVPAGFEPAFSP